MENSETALVEERFRAIKTQAGEFTLSLVKALLQTGYYSADHPLAKVAAKELHGQFKEITRESFEVSYLLLSATDDRGIMVDGLVKEPIEVSKFLTGTMGEHFVRKFHDYFLRNKIASFTIKRGIDEKEFEKFMDLWVTWSSRVVEAESKSAVAIMSEELTKAGILSVTVIGMADVPGTVRQLPWPVKVSIGRLRNDLARLPELKKVRPEAMSQLKSQAISDIMRPLTRPELTREILMNTDLVGEGLDSFSNMEIEDSMIAAVPKKRLLPLTNEVLELREVLIRGDQNLSLPGRDILEYQETVERVSRKVLVRLAAQQELTGAGDLLLKCYKDALISDEDLPDSIRRRIKAYQMADRYMKNPDMYLKDFAICAGPKTYLKYLNVLTLVIPVLVERGETAALSNILSIMHEHMHEEAPPFVGRTRFLEETLAVLVRSGCVEGLVQLAANTPKDSRQILENGVALFGERSVDSLVNLLSASEDVSTRKAACSMLERIGTGAVPKLSEELDSHKHPWYAVRNIIALLGDLRAGRAVKAIRQYGGHPHPRVREECVNAIGRILEDEGEKDLLRFLADKDKAVVRRAIHHLGAMHSCDPDFLDVLNETIRIRSRKEDEPDEIAQAACLSALTRYSNAPLPAKPDLEATLTEIIRPSRLRSFIPGRIGIRTKSRDLVVLAIQVLGFMGTSKSLGMLSELAKESDAALQEAGADAAENIRNRQTSQVVQKPLKY